MQAIAGSASGRPVVPVGIVVSSLVVLTVTVFTGLPVKIVAPVVCLVVAIAVLYKVVLSWRALLGLVLMVILFVPIRRYTLPMNLPFELEPYRLVVMIVGTGWLASLLIDRRVRVRPTGFGGPLRLFMFAALGSILANPGLVLTVQGHVVKQLSYFASFLIVLFVIASVVRTHEDVDRLVKVLVGSGAVIAFFALAEANTGYNVFNHLSTFFPFLKAGYVPDIPIRGGRLRTYGPAQHAIELGAILVLLVPLAVYLARRQRQRRWWIAGALLLMGSLATLSRTSMLMLAVVIVTFVILRPQQTRRLWPALAPLAVAVHIAIPGAIGTISQSFFPAGGLVKQQSYAVGSGRLASLGPALAKVSREPLLGQGFGTRITDGVGMNAPILDDQWLGTLVETGLLGAFAWLWLFVRALRTFGRGAKRDLTDRGWLLAAVTASTAAFMIGMLTFDSFTFTQVTFVLFILIGLGQVTARLPVAEPSLVEVPVRPVRPAPAGA
jgi:hypothetical protein